MDDIIVRGQRHLRYMKANHCGSQRAMLIQERDRAMAQEQAAAARRSVEEAQALRQKQEADRQRHFEQQQKLQEQQLAFAIAQQQAQRMNGWFQRKI